MAAGKVLIAGASGVIGDAALRLFASQPDWAAVGVSRRPRKRYDGATVLAADLTDRAASKDAFSRLTDITHVVYAAVQEAPGLTPGWSDRRLMDTNLAMLRNLVEPLTAASRGLRHITLLQGGKAYGWHVGKPSEVPARERQPRVVHDNFYFLQEDYLRSMQEGSGWVWTVLRPMVVFGDAIGVNMNPLLPIGAYAALLREAGEPLHFPGGAATVSQAADADLIAEALVWAATAPAAANQIFNVTNGDVFTWRGVWPAIAAAFAMAVGEDRPASLVRELRARQEGWAALVGRYGLAAPPELAGFLGQSDVYADQLLGYGRTATPALPALMSTVKIRQAGFARCVDTELMMSGWIRRLQQQRLLPAPRS